MIGTQTTIIGAAIVRLGIEAIGCFGWFVVIPDLLVILSIIRDKHFRTTVFGASLQHKYLIVLEDDLRLHSFEAMWTQTQRKIIIGVISDWHA